MELKAKKYKLLTTDIVVTYVDSVYDSDDDRWIFGRTVNEGNLARIEISTKYEDGRALPAETIAATLRHELFHVILDTLYFTELSANESLVEWLSTATLMLNKQGLAI